MRDTALLDIALGVLWLLAIHQSPTLMAVLDQRGAATGVDHRIPLSQVVELRAGIQFHTIKAQAMESCHRAGQDSFGKWLSDEECEELLMVRKQHLVKPSHRVLEWRVHLIAP